MEAIEPIRTFHARRGRTTASMRRLLTEVAPRYAPRRRMSERPTVLEVGCGGGSAALAWADAHPGHDVLAYDVYPPGIAHLLDELERRPRDNVWVSTGDAVDALRTELAPGALERVHVFFPDPWPKTRHHKRRFVRPDLVELMVCRLAPGGVLRVATDAPDYAVHARVVLDSHPRLSGGQSHRPPWRPVTPYEAKAVAAGRAVVELRYTRR